jgi:mannose-6-phosphate isomerase-like protein (cupin superfamily)
MAEIVRGGIMSIDKGQFEGAHSLGMNHWQTMFHVILPQAIKNIMPSIGNEFVVNIKDMSHANNDFRRSLWTGNNLQMTLMNINAGEDIGAEIHSQTDQIIIVANGHGVFLYGDSLEHLDNQTPLFKHSTIFIPEKTYHNIVNTSNVPLTLISIYANNIFLLCTETKINKYYEQDI